MTAIHNAQAILFDLDGVLVDSMPVHVQAWTHALTCAGLRFQPADLENEIYNREGQASHVTARELHRKYRGAPDDDTAVAEMVPIREGGRWS